MSIRTYFEEIAAAIKEKNTDVITVTPAQMPAAILAIPSGGGDVVLMTRAEWDALTTAEKQSYGLVAIEDSATGYERGVLVDGSEYVELDWSAVKKIVIKGNNRDKGGYTQLGDIRFSDGTNYLPSNMNNISSSVTKYGSFVVGTYQGDTQYLFDNSANSKTISSSSGVTTYGAFEWTTIFTNAIDLSQYTRLELWTANDSSGRDPYTDVEIIFTDALNVTLRLIIGDTSFPTTRLTLGYYNDNYQTEVTV